MQSKFDQDGDPSLWPTLKCLDIATFRQQVRARPMMPLEHLSFTSIEPQNRLVDVAEKTIKQGFAFSNDSTLISPPVDWHQGTRTFQYLMHAWEPIAKVMATWDAFGGDHYLSTALAFARDWLEHAEPTADVSSERFWAEEECDQEDGLMTWAPLAAARRAYRLAFLLDAAARIDACTDDFVWALTSSYLHHLAVLTDEKSFSRHNNVGIHQAICQLAAARRFLDLLDVTAEYRIALTRTLEMVGAQFAESGIHREHSPEYHLAVLTTLTGAVEAGLIDRDIHDKRILRAEEALAWMVTPAGYLAPIGDSHPIDVNLGLEVASRCSSAVARHVLSGGKLGTPAPVGVACFANDGFAFARLVPEVGEPHHENESYLALTAAFHSRTHKQADHLSFVWHDRGCCVLTDPGRFAYLGQTRPGDGLFEEGFWYSDRRRVYVESTRAHNTVEIDGRNFPRRGVTPFGSALVSAELQNGIFVSECTLYHFKSIRHRRILIMKPSSFLIVLDWLQDRANAPHRYRQWFQFDPLWTVKRDDGRFTACTPEMTSDESLIVTPLIGDASPSIVFNGQEEPEMQGWVSEGQGAIRPAPSIHMECDGDDIVLIGTLFCYGHKSSVIAERTRANVSLSRVLLTWIDEAGRNTLSILRTTKESILVEHQLIGG